ncbi:DEXDc domain containing protein [uncultured Caudovirales phage]|uniref:DEXDc domain containing protein n=1 Tax=uncultured Caudovirales phage TaxID=2100421 RepID=A0A6J5RM87_9CAUD|nr:DEXDc domain containing protein [uncultured Caudovirales phage]
MEKSQPKKLFPYQQEGAEWLASMARAGLHDEMGVGKTATLIRAANLIKGRRGLVIGPAMLRENFIREWDIFSERDAKLCKGQTINDFVAWQRGDKDILVTSYEMATKWYREWENHGEVIDFMILDEAHYLKNAFSKRSKAILGNQANGMRCWAQWARYSWWSTGTPMPNNPIDIYTFLRFSGAINTNYGNFMTEYFTIYGFKPVVKRNRVEELRGLIGGVSIRRTKKSVGLQLPPIFLSLTLLEGDAAPVLHLLREHPGLEGSILEAVEKGGLSFLDAGHVATLRRLIGTAKAVPYAHTLLEELKSSGDKRIVFGVHTDALEYVNDFLTKNGVKGYLVNGATPEKTRVKAVKDFQEDPECQFFIGNIKAAGTGLTLTAAADIDMLESDWTPAGNAQAIMRAHRIGQKRTVRARFITLADSFDVVVNRIVSEKTASIAEIEGSAMDASPPNTR